MKNIILLTLTVLVMIGCRRSVEADTNDCSKNYNVIILDSCEYYSSAYVYDLTHKGNCRFCKERDSIKWEKRKKELEELVIKLKKKQL